MKPSARVKGSRRAAMSGGRTRVDHADGGGDDECRSRLLELDAGDDARGDVDGGGGNSQATTSRESRKPGRPAATRVDSPKLRLSPRCCARAPSRRNRICSEIGKLTGMTTQTAADLYAIPQEHQDFRDLVRQIATERVAPRAAEIDREDEYPWDLRQLLAEQDILGLPFEEEYGGTGTGTLMLQMAVEELAKASAAVALILMIRAGHPADPSGRLGRAQAAAAAGVRLGERSPPAFCYPSPTRARIPARWDHAIPDSPETSSVIDPDELDRRAPGSPTSSCCWRTDHRRRAGAGVFVVEKDRGGFSIPSYEHKLGIHGSPTGQPVFEDVRVPAFNVIGEVGRGLSVALGTLERTRLGAAAQAVGISQGAIDFANDYAKERKAFGKPINELQGIQFKLADMQTKTAAARELLYKACAMADRDEPQLGMYTSDGQALRLPDAAMEARSRRAGARRYGPDPSHPARPRCPS